jgi:hypothetical protein
VRCGRGIALDEVVVDAEAAAREAGLGDAGPAESGWRSNRALIQADRQTRATLSEAAAKLRR